MSRHNIDYKKKWVDIGDYVAVYPFATYMPGRGNPFTGVVQKVKKNKYGRISYVIRGIEYMAEELFPSKDENKLKIPMLRIRTSQLEKNT